MNETRQARLLDMLACPSCHGGLVLADLRSAHGLVWDARLVCDQHGLVGVIADTKPSFLDRDLGVAEHRHKGYKRDVLPLVQRDGDWEQRVEGLLSLGEGTDRLTLDATFDAARVSFLAHDWSGIAEIVVDGEVAETRDLHAKTRGDIVVAVDLPDLAHRTLEIRATGRRTSASSGAQVLVKAIEAWVGEDDLPAPVFGPVDRGNAYPERFLDLLAAMPADGVALDCGGGDRQVGDVRLYNLEYMPYAAPDLYGDGLNLPFRTGAFDLILSQAVLEHVPDPQRAVDELRRVLSPSGSVYAEIAFTQPLHAVPSHYFNVTPFGAEHLFRNWSTAAIDWFGGVLDTVEWWGRLVGLEHRWPAERRDALRELLADFDDGLSYDELRFFASAVSVLATP